MHEQFLGHEVEEKLHLEDANQKVSSATGLENMEASTSLSTTLWPPWPVAGIALSLHLPPWQQVEIQAFHQNAEISKIN
jgi:hypothetical protein